ncbi:hypothetical protein [Streptomyces sp. Qhu_M48]|uniref:hypothetical protein n=1 Tax=Streptomyces sp. Qhu_M48 TaxID=3435889 RepID=UPI003F4FF78D
MCSSPDTGWDASYDSLVDISELPGDRRNDLFAWPDIAAAMAQLDAKGIDVTRILTDAHAAGTGVDQAVAAVTTVAPA